MRIAINGMGRIGRLLFRRLLHISGITIVAVNDLMPAENLAYLLKYDSVYGTNPFSINLSGQSLQVQGQNIAVLNEPNPNLLPWQQLHPDVILECTGAFSNKEQAGRHLQAGAKKVLLSTTGSADIPLFIWGFNNELRSWDHDIISPGGCMTNCATSVIHAMEPWGIESLQLNVIHSYTSRQELIDAPHKDFRRGRAAAESIIPVPVDLADSLERLFPQLKKQMATLTTRVPVANGALADFTFHVKKNPNVTDINDGLKNASTNGIKGVMNYTEEPIVSLDVKGSTYSAVIDGSLTSVAGQQVKVIALFDNEYGYTSRIIDWLMLYKSSQNVI